MCLRSFLFFVAIFATFVSCSSKKGPEDILRSFVNYRFSDAQTRQGIYQYVGGEFQQIIETMSDEDFQELMKTAKYRKKRLKVLVKKCEPTKCVITYTLKYEQASPTNEEEFYEVEVKKIAELALFEDTWKIIKVDNIKTYLDGQDSPIKI